MREKTRNNEKTFKKKIKNLKINKKDFRLYYC